MTALWIAMAALTAAALILLLVPLLRRDRAAETDRGAYDIAVYRDQLAEVDGDLERGVLTPEQAEAARLEIQRRMLAAAPDADPGTAGKAATPARRSNMAAALIIAVTVPAGAVALYLGLGSPDDPDRPLAARTAAPAHVDGGGQPGSVESMVAGLAKRLEAEPDNLDGWLMLGRSYATLERYGEAAGAYRRAADLIDADADPGLAAAVGSNWAEALVMADGGAVGATARELFRRARAADPFNPKPRFYLGLERARAGDRQGALAEWVDLVAVSPPDAPYLAAVRQQIAEAAASLGIDPATLTPSPEAAELAKTVMEPSATARGPAPAAPAPAPAAAPGPTRADMEAAASMTPEERAEMIRGMVERLAARLEENPDDPAGWDRLAKAYEVLGEREKAAEARKRAAEARGE